MGHTSYRCNLANNDEMKGLVRKDGKEFRLPDGTAIPFDRTRPTKSVVDQYHGTSSSPGIIRLPPGTQTQKKEEPAVELQTSFGKLEEIGETYSSTYECDVAKRLRSGKEIPERPTSKKVRSERDEVMDIDSDRIMEIARQNTYPEPTYSLEETTKNSPTKKVQFKDPEDTNKAPKEKAPRKTYVEKPLAKEYPEAEENIVSRILGEGKIELTYGEVFAISNGVVESLKKRTNPRRVPIDQTKSTNVGGMESEEEDEQEETKDHPTHYACPLGYISMNINGKNFQALLDNGSMVNVLSLSFACKMGLIITEKKMNLKGIGGHKNEIIGIAENVPVQIGQITKDVHFWISSGDVQPILGKPFLISTSANIKFHEHGAESLSIQHKGKAYLVPIIIPANQKWETQFPVNTASKSSHFLSLGTFQK